MKRMLEKIEEMGKEITKEKRLNNDGIDELYKVYMYPTYNELISKAVLANKEELLELYEIITSSKFKDYDELQSDAMAILDDSRDIYEFVDMRRLIYSLNTFNLLIKRLKLKIYSLIIVK